MPVNRVLAAEFSSLDVWSIALKVIGLACMLVAALVFFSARKEVRRLPRTRIIPWAGLVFAVAWATDGILDLVGVESTWRLLVTFVEVAAAIILVIAFVRETRRRAVDSG